MNKNSNDRIFTERRPFCGNCGRCGNCGSCVHATNRLIDAYFLKTSVLLVFFRTSNFDKFFLTKLFYFTKRNTNNKMTPEIFRLSLELGTGIITQQQYDEYFEQLSYKCIEEVREDVSYISEHSSSSIVESEESSIEFSTDSIHSSSLDSISSDVIEVPIKKVTKESRIIKDPPRRKLVKKIKQPINYVCNKIMNSGVNKGKRCGKGTQIRKTYKDFRYGENHIFCSDCRRKPGCKSLRDAFEKMSPKERIKELNRLAALNDDKMLEEMSTD